jgi:hypothetical protein
MNASTIDYHFISVMVLCDDRAKHCHSNLFLGAGPYLLLDEIIKYKITGPDLIYAFQIPDN